MSDVAQRARAAMRLVTEPVTRASRRVTATGNVATTAPAGSGSAPSSSSVLADEQRRLLAVDLATTSIGAFVAGARFDGIVITALCAVSALAVSGRYRPRLQFSVLDDLPGALLAVGVALLASGWYAQSAQPALVGGPVAWPAFLLAFVVAGRAFAYIALRRRRRRQPGQPTIVLGCSDVAIRIAEALREDRTYGLSPAGFVGPPILTASTLPTPLLGPAEDLDEIIAQHGPRNVIVAFPATSDAGLVGILRQCRRQKITVFVVPRLFELPLGRAKVELVRGIPLVRMRPEPIHLRRWPIKRITDVGGAALGLVVLSPLFALCALAVRWESGRDGVLFRQERVGQGGRRFTIMKFRSLTPSSDHESRVRWNINCDARIGPVGRWLRATSLDELPQLLNVLRGQMSLVGPRPERPYFVEQFRRTYSGYMDRHRVPAGITGWAQINGLRGDTSIEERVRFDNYYIENWSLGLDLRIILRTLGSMFSIRGQ